MNDKAATRLVMITGAGAGLGEAMARRFHAAGDRVVATDQDGQRVIQLADELGERVQAFSLDVTDAEQWSTVVTAVEQQHGPIDVLINNAGVAVAGSLEDTSLEDWRWVMEIDLMGVVMGCKAVAPLMRGRGRGHLINVASFAGLAGAPEINAYGTAKAAVVAMSEGLRAELDDSGVAVSVLCPAFVQTRLLESMRATDDQYHRRVSRWMANSGVSAADVAEVVYQAVQTPKFLLLTHRETRWLWRLKRHLPRVYYALLMRGVRRARHKR
jgi:NADP-dependent 3-hydroxy acid dehydrogenase YdfG